MATSLFFLKELALAVRGGGQAVEGFFDEPVYLGLARRAPEAVLADALVTGLNTVVVERDAPVGVGVRLGAMREGQRASGSNRERSVYCTQL